MCERLYCASLLSPTLYVPFLNTEVTLTWGVYLVFAAFVMVGCVNAVNLTDGLDGLAGSVTLAVCVFFAVLSKWWEMGAVGVFAGALGGGLLGFLLYNFHPAKVFMGDTGSLFLGGAVCAMVLAEGYSIGWGKQAGGMVKNHYPKGLRKN